MKQNVRVLGVDDSSFKFSDETVTIVGVLLRLPNYVEAVMRTEVEVDGGDATDKLVEMVNGSRYKEQVKTVLLDGIALGGFNVVDLDEFFERTGVAIATVTRDKPDYDGIKSALQEHFSDWEERLGVMKRRELLEIETDHKPIYVMHVGIDEDELREILKMSTVRGALPEPVRIAHLIATGVTQGESRGKA